MLNTLDLDSSSLNNVELAEFVKAELISHGYILLKNYPIDTNCIVDASADYLKLCEMIGLPISHDENNSIIWDIKKAPQSESAVQTYSEHDGEAELHTDSQYRDRPEDYFGLLTLAKASCGGGMSLVMRINDLFEELLERPNGETLIHTLQTEDYPFIVPSVFKQEQNDLPEFVYGPILTESTIRFRVDTMRKALPFHEGLLSDSALLAFNELTDIVTNSPRIKRFHLEPRDLIFINNTTTLHGRTAFKDANRHMLRIRMNEV